MNPQTKKKLKIWAAIFVGSLILVGAMAYVLRSRSELYRGGFPSPDIETPPAPPTTPTIPFPTQQAQTLPTGISSGSVNTSGGKLFVKLDPPSPAVTPTRVKKGTQDLDIGTLSLKAETGDVKIKSIIFTKNGDVNAARDLLGVRLRDLNPLNLSSGNLVAMSTCVEQSSNAFELKFVPELTIMKDKTKTLTLMTNVSALAAPETSFKLTLQREQDISGNHSGVGLLDNHAEFSSQSTPEFKIIDEFQVFLDYNNVFFEMQKSACPVQARAGDDVTIAAVNFIPVLAENSLGAVLENLQLKVTVISGSPDITLRAVDRYPKFPPSQTNPPQGPLEYSGSNLDPSAGTFLFNFTGQGSNSFTPRGIFFPKESTPKARTILIKAHIANESASATFNAAIENTNNLTIKDHLGNSIKSFGVLPSVGNIVTITAESTTGAGQTINTNPTINLAWNKQSYNLANSSDMQDINVTMTRTPDANPNEIGRYSVLLSSDADTDGVAVNLRETGTSTGVYVESEIGLSMENSAIRDSHANIKIGSCPSRTSPGRIVAAYQESYRSEAQIFYDPLPAACTPSTLTAQLGTPPAQITTLAQGAAVDFQPIMLTLSRGGGTSSPLKLKSVKFSYDQNIQNKLDPSRLSNPKLLRSRILSAAGVLTGERELVEIPGVSARLEANGDVAAEFTSDFPLLNKTELVLKLTGNFGPGEAEKKLRYTLAAADIVTEPTITPTISGVGSISAFSIAANTPQNSTMAWSAASYDIACSGTAATLTLVAPSLNTTAGADTATVTVTSGRFANGTTFTLTESTATPGTFTGSVALNRAGIVNTGQSLGVNETTNDRVTASITIAGQAITPATANTTSNGTCQGSGQQSTSLRIINYVLNDNLTGTATPNDFVLRINNNNVINGTAITSGAATQLPVGQYTVSVDPRTEYNVSFPADQNQSCNTSGQVTLAAGESKVCIILNDDKPRQIPPGGGGGGGNGGGNGGGSTGTTTPPITQIVTMSCEQQGYYTYTGPDKPGVRFKGMCIPCSTQVYQNNGGSCTAPLPAPASQQPPARQQVVYAPAQRPAAGDNYDPNLYRSQRIVRAPEQGGTGPEMGVYFLVALIAGPTAAWIRRRRRNSKFQAPNSK